MKIRFIELPTKLREGGLEKAAADMARFLGEQGIKVVRGEVGRNDTLDVDIAHFHGLWSPLHYKVAMACRDRGIPTIVSPHGMLEPWAWKHRRWKKWPYFAVFEKRRLSWTNALLATSRNEAENLRRFFPYKNIQVLTLGIEPDVFPAYEEARAALGWRTDEKVLLYLSRIHPKKGLLEILRVLEEIAGNRPLKGLRLLILGDGPIAYVKKCQALADRLKEHMPIEWLAPQWGVGKWKYLQGADLFCLPTYSENFGIVMLEAGIVGTPVFTTTGTPWKLIQDAGFGWVVEPTPAAYRGVLEDFLAKPMKLLHQMRQPFSEWTRRNYSWPSVIEHYIDFYRKIMEAK